MPEPTVTPCNALIPDNCQARASFFGMDTGMLVSSMRTLLNYKASVLLERPSLCEDKYRDDVWAHVLRLRVAECEEALGLPPEKIVLSTL